VPSLLALDGAVLAPRGRQSDRCLNLSVVARVPKSCSGISLGGNNNNTTSLWISAPKVSLTEPGEKEPTIGGIPFRPTGTTAELTERKEVPNGIRLVPIGVGGRQLFHGWGLNSKRSLSGAVRHLGVEAEADVRAGALETLSLF